MVKIAYSAWVLPSVIGPILPAAFSTNQRLPSGPVTIPVGPVLGRRQDCDLPLGVIWPFLSAQFSMKYGLPSEPTIRFQGPASAARLYPVNEP